MLNEDERAELERLREMERFYAGRRLKGGLLTGAKHKAEAEVSNAPLKAFWAQHPGERGLPRKVCRGDFGPVTSLGPDHVKTLFARWEREADTAYGPRGLPVVP